MIDCNSNGVPDEIDISTGASTDCNNDTIPDDCQFIDNPPMVDQGAWVEGDAVQAQNFDDGGYPTYTIKQWDDFTVPYNVSLGTGQAWFNPPSWTGYGNVDFLVEIADAPGGAEAGGNVIANTIGAGDAGVITWDFTGVTLAPGTYWMSVQAAGGFGTYGMVYWFRTNVNAPSGSMHYYHNPGGGWNHGTDPQPITAWGDAPADLAFVQNIIKLADCNGNGMLDECDIADGTSQDTNNNGIPDECEGPAVCPGDSNCDDAINWRDIDYFVAAQNDNVASWEAMFTGTPPCAFGNNDVNADGAVNWRDIDPLVALMNTVCP
jgi:hypothetical protein